MGNYWISIHEMKNTDIKINTVEISMDIIIVPSWASLGLRYWCVPKKYSLTVKGKRARAKSLYFD